LSARDFHEEPPQFVGDLQHLPGHGHSHRSLTWWGMMGLIAVEGVALGLAVAAYLYLSNHDRLWPPQQLLPTPWWGTAFTALVVLSFIPNLLLNRHAEQERLREVRMWLVLMNVVGVVLVVIRYFEFTSLHVAWSDSAYGSIVVTLLGLHTAHLVTDLYDTAVLTALMFTRHGHSGRRFVDVAENAIYWNFVIYAWLPIYVVLYFAPQWL
jgi:cytochrome c oxidase subunit 3